MLKRLTIALFLLLISVSALAQNLGIDFENLKSNDLSDEQVISLFERAQSEGYSVPEIEAVAVARGMAPSEVSKLKSRLMQLRTGSGQARANQSIQESEERLRDTEDNTETAESSTMDVPQNEVKVFGSQLFTNKNLTFAPSQNIPTPKNYELGPGDEIIIDIWGATANNYQLSISPEGSILINNIGPLSISGMTIEEASEFIKNRLSSIYSGITGPNKNTFVQVSLGRLRTIKVNIVGEVRLPGTYSLSSLSTVFNALYTSGGPSAGGTYRAIKVIRENKVIEEVDLYDFLVQGDQSSNIRLRDQDIIQVGPYLNRISVNGETKRTGLFETTEGETFADVLEFAGGFNQQAYTKRIKIRRNTDTEKEVIQISYPEDDNLVLKSGDVISVGKILDRFTNRVEIQGAVFREGEYQLEKNKTLSELIQNAEGLMGDAYMERAIIYRTLPDYTVKTIPVNLRELMQDPDEQDIELKKDDVVQISSIFDLQEDYNVVISGEVNAGGTFPYRDDMTVKDLIFMADGFTSSAAEYNVEVARRITDTGQGQTLDQIADIYNLEINEDLSLSNPDLEFKLEPFDQVFVRRSPSYMNQRSVQIKGQVLYPGTYVMDTRNFRISDLIRKAGGLTEYSYPEGASLTRNFKGLEDAAFSEDSTLSGNARETISQVGIELREILRNPKSELDLLMYSGDVLEVPQQMQTVNIQGEVLFPINARFESGKGFKKYINSAGGFTEKANKRKGYIVYANGEVDRIRQFLFFRNYPDVKPGSMIYIPPKEKEVQISPQERIAILSTIVSMAAIVTNTIFQIRRN